MKHKRGPEIRLNGVRHVFEYLPPWTMTDMWGVQFYCCGRCFRKLGDDPFEGRPGKLTPGVPMDTRCVLCGRRADPFD